MAIGTTAAILGGGAILGGIAGSVLGADATRDAARDANESQQQSTAAQIALAQQFRQQNQANLQPWLNSGTRANSLIDSFLYAPATTTYYPDQTPTGMGGPSQPTPTGPVQPPVTQPTTQPQPTNALAAFGDAGGIIPSGGTRALGGKTAIAGERPGAGYVFDDSGMANPEYMVQQPQTTTAPATSGMTEAQWAQGAINAMLPRVTRSSIRAQLQALSHDPVAAFNYLMSQSAPSSDQYPLYQAYLQSNPRPSSTVQPGGGQPGGGGGQPAGNPMTGYEAFVRSPYYQFGMNEGLNALNHGYAGSGMLQSGAAMKGITRFGQDYAYGRMNEFLGMAGQQSDRGLQAGSAIAGVSQNALASTSQAIQSGANAQSNAAIASGNARAGMWNGIGGTLGGVFGTYMGSAYGR